MFVTVGDNKKMCRIDPAIHEEAIKRKGSQTVLMKEREYKGYVYINEDGIKSKRDLAYWVGISLEFNKRAKATPKKKRNKLYGECYN